MKSFNETNSFKMTQLNTDDDSESDVFDDQSDKKCPSTTGSLSSSGCDLTPCDTPPREWMSPRIPRRTLHLGEDSTWQILPKHSRFNLHLSSAKFQSLKDQIKSTSDFKFKFIVGLLFLAIIFIILCTAYFYKREFLLIVVRDRILFEQNKRKFDIIDVNGYTLLSGNLARRIPEDIPPIRCDDNEVGICLHWKYRSKLTVDYERYENSISCYKFHWISFTSNSRLQDCFDVRRAFWYGIGEIDTLQWPLNQVSFDKTAFVTSHEMNRKHPLGSLLRRLWISSNGIAIEVPLNIPLHVSLDSKESRLCFESSLDSPYSTYPNTTSLDYNICAGPNIVDIHKFMMKPKPERDLRHYIERIIWSVDLTSKSFKQQLLQDYSDKIMNYGFEPGLMLLDLKWQKRIGDLEMDDKLFANPLIIFNILHNKGFKVLVKISPHVEINAKIFNDAFKQNRFIFDKKLEVPLLSRCGEDFEKLCGVINMHSPGNGGWLVGRIIQAKNKYTIDGFVFIHGQTSLTPFVKDENTDVDVYLKNYQEVAKKSSSIVGISTAIDIDDFEGFYSLLKKDKSWSSLRTIIPTVLTLGLIGYSLIDAGDVTNNKTNHDKELNLRWLQLMMFLPIVHFDEQVLSDDEDVKRVVKELIQLRESKLVPALVQGLAEYQASGVPIIRPLWWLQMDARDSYKIDNQFAIGNDLIVAPVLEKGKTEIDIYLPVGWWQDEINGQVIRGGKWMRNYQVPVDKIAYFLRIEHTSK